MYSPKEELKIILNGQNLGYFPRSIPVFGPVVDLMKITGAFFPEANYEAKPMAKLALAAHELADWNAIMMPWASTIEMEALGCKVNIKNNIEDYPQFEKPVFEDIDRITFKNNILGKGSFPAIFEAIAIVRDKIVKKHNDAIPVICMFQGPFTIASYSIGFEKMFKYMIKDNKKAAKALDTISDLCITYAIKMLKSGGDFVLMSDPVSEGLGNNEFGEIMLPVLKKITANININKMIHICGKTNRILEHLSETGFDGYSFDYPKIQIDFLRQTVKNKMKIIGSVPTVTHLLEGSYSDVFDMSLFMIKSGVDILAPSCGLSTLTPIENIKAMSAAIKYWNESKG